MRRSMKMRMVGLLVIIAVVDAALLATSQLEMCVNGGTMTCDERFAVLLSVDAGQNSTESVQSVVLRSATDNASPPNTYQLVDTLEISLAKSSIRLVYPLTYLRQYNNDPHELLLLRDGSGKSFDALINPCVDDPTRDDVSCGWVLDSSGGRVSQSQGFCCSCSALHCVSNSCTSRGGLSCSGLTALGRQAAHCLRMDSLSYSAFGIGAPQIDFTLDVIIKRCPGSFPANGVPVNASLLTPTMTTTPRLAASCSYNVVVLSPTVPRACVALTPIHVSTTTASSTACDLQISLVGDFVSYASPPDFSSKLLLAPLVCDNTALCGNRTTESSDKWLLVPASLTTTGIGCDLIGVSYSAFNSQGSACAQPAGSCLNYQPQDYYAADAAAVAAGKPTTAFLSGFAPAGGSIAPLLGGNNLRLQLTTTAFEASVLSLYINAASVKYVQNVASANITSVSAPSADALSGGGRLSVTITSTGNVVALFTGKFSCDDIHDDETLLLSIVQHDVLPRLRFTHCRRPHCSVSLQYPLCVV